jgi:L-2-hydroxyglutarate oxidase LhgO
VSVQNPIILDDFSEPQPDLTILAARSDFYKDAHPRPGDVQQPPAVAVQDFLIQGPLDHGVTGLINLFGIESPGLTSSLAIANYVGDLAGV